MPEVANFALKRSGPCPCSPGCGLDGVYKRKFKNDGVQHVVGCTCRRCKGRRSKRGGGEGQRTSRKRWNTPLTSSIRTGHEEFDPGWIRREDKSGAQIMPAVNAFDRIVKQPNAAKSMGDNRPLTINLIPNPRGKRIIHMFETNNDQDMHDFAFALSMQMGAEFVRAVAVEMGIIDG
jgi:hypothetical protein